VLVEAAGVLKGAEGGSMDGKQIAGQLMQIISKHPKVASKLLKKVKL
jgi:hypothetical protein